ncbi:MAG: hypothetical protein ACK4ZJ_13040, partial [Allorhizobium sp.]
KFQVTGAAAPVAALRAAAETMRSPSMAPASSRAPAYTPAPRKMAAAAGGAAPSADNWEEF